MIIKKDYLKKDINYLEEEKKGLNKAVDKLEERFKKSEVDREKFLKQNAEFAKRQQELRNRMNKNI